ncbi:CBS domain-containing protein [Thiocapsa marina]|uniref:CBS domain containing membrane protein n=1 Tax=Thiocapsa marina 5811 TaxID=768671 RepID=F9UFJ0_9GAMM|nr:CBS domain-containing protein [Thiocapsa marina]EGV16864.1 CBS domain containing membrane protein [Thiocapsa marina 5811]
MTQSHLHLFEQPDHANIDEVSGLELSDADIIDAMREIPGYIDITTTDFRTVYHLAHAHAVERMNSRMCARNLMRAPIQPLHPSTPLYRAAELFVRQGVKALPVVMGGGRVTGILTETDILERLGAESFLELLPRLLEHCDRLADCCHETATSAMMTSPAVTVTEHAGFAQIMAAFKDHGGRSTPVVDDGGRLVGLLMRKDFLAACQLDAQSLG